MPMYLTFAGVAVVILILVGGVVFSIFSFNVQAPVSTATTTTPVVSMGEEPRTNTTAPQAPKTNETKQQGFTATLVPADDWHSYMPDLKRDIQFGITVPENARVTMREKIALFKSNLEKDPADILSWLDLGAWYYSARDFVGAMQVWEFLARANPKDTIAYDNLAKLFLLDLKDVSNAEYYFKKSIELNPDVITPYLELHTLYADTYKTDSTLAVDILEKAAAHFASDPDPLTQLGVYWRDRGNTAKAREAFERALDRARTANNVALIGAIGEELARLPQ